MKKGFRWEGDRLYVGSCSMGEVHQDGRYVYGAIYTPRGWVWSPCGRQSYSAAMRDAERMCLDMLWRHYLGARQLLEALGEEAQDVV